MKPFTRSIRRHLLCWLLIPICIICTVGACITYGIAVNFAQEAYDTALLDTAHSVSKRLEFGRSYWRIDLPPAALAVLKHGDRDDLYYQIVTAKAEVISGDTFVPDPPAGAKFDEDSSIFYDGEIAGRPVRIVELKVNSPDNAGGYLLVKIAETVNGRADLIQSILLAVLLPQLALIFFAVLAVWFGVKRGLTPLAVVKDAVASRTPSDLRLLDEHNVPSEVKPLVQSINNLLWRLQEDRESQRRFVANAAHQLRTPLAGLKTQTELALRSSGTLELRESLAHISTSADRASRMAQQLLALAKLEPAAMANRKMEPVDLVAIAREATTALVPQALTKSIDIGFEGPQFPLNVMAVAENLHDLAQNLIENAVLYTQEGGNITVRVDSVCEAGSRAAQVRLSVEDNGPGIPQSERDQVFERFYRILGNRVNGSGLGLAIVREIAVAHDATVQIADGPGGIGTTFSVSFNLVHDFSPALIGAGGVVPPPGFPGGIESAAGRH